MAQRGFLRTVCTLGENGMYTKPRTKRKYKICTSKNDVQIFRSFLVYNSNFVAGARVAVLLCIGTTQKIYRGGAEVDFFSRSRYYNKNYGYPRTSDEGYFFSETVGKL